MKSKSLKELSEEEKAKQNVGRPKQYEDVGCAAARVAGYFGKCVDCPLETCFEYRYKQGIGTAKKEQRDIKIMEDLENGMTITEAAKKYLVGKRTIERARKISNT